jgi:hypothetical protein
VDMACCCVQVPRARLLLAKARSGSGAQYPRVWMKSAIVERQLGNDAEVRQPLFCLSFVERQFGNAEVIPRDLSAVARWRLIAN